MKLQKFRHACAAVFHNPVDGGAVLVNVLLSAFIILTIAAIPLHFLPGLEWADNGLLMFERIAVAVFTIEYILQVWSADRPFLYIFSRYSLIDLLAIVPFYLGAMGILEETHTFSFFAFRLLRLLKLGQIHDEERDAVAENSKKHHGLFQALENETIELVAHKHPIVFLAAMLPPLVFTSFGLSILFYSWGNVFASVFAIFSFSLATTFFVKTWLDFHYDVIYVTNHRIVLQDHHLFGGQLNDMVYEVITNVRPNTIGIVGYIFGFGTIHIETASDGGDQEFNHIADPFKVARYIYKNRQRILEKDNVDNLTKPHKHQEQDVPSLIHEIREEHDPLLVASQ
jgi:hypothetical protein